MKISRGFQAQFLAVCLFATSCETREKTTELSEPSPAPVVEDTVPQAERKWPLLNQKNFEPFLMGYFQTHSQRKIALNTPYGQIKFELFDDTPLHTANFLMLIERGYFKGTVFTRVIDKFVIQGGTNDSEIEEVKRILIGAYDLPPEIRSNRVHRKGALAMAREYENNPDMLSSAYNFYIVEGEVLNIPQIMSIERQHDVSISSQKREVYTTIGGTPHLDGKHTVFGQVYEGWDALEKLSAIPTDKSDWPLEPHYTDFEIIQ